MLILLLVVAGSLSTEADMYLHSDAQISEKCRKAINSYKMELLELNVNSATNYYFEGGDLQNELENPKILEIFKTKANSDFGFLSKQDLTQSDLVKEHREFTSVLVSLFSIKNLSEDLVEAGENTNKLSVKPLVKNCSKTDVSQFSEYYKYLVKEYKKNGGGMKDDDLLHNSDEEGDEKAKKAKRGLSSIRLPKLFKMSSLRKIKL